MTINKIFGNQGLGSVAGAKGAQKATPQKTSGPQKKDQVNFSSILQEVSQTRSTSSVADLQRTEKLVSLKEQIASGAYQPDLHKVAASLLKFIAEEG
jgi:negative regulator of flagellin synthesis FlgM